MTDRLEIHVAGDPIPQDHRNHSRIIPGGRVVTTRYLTPEAREWRATILRVARRVPGFPAEPWDGPVRVTIEAYFARPQRLCRARDPEGPIRKNSKPDSDNLVKSTLDALTPPRSMDAEMSDDLKAQARRGYLWLDDCQVHLGSVDRWYVAKGCAPGVIIIAEKIAEESELFTVEQTA